MRSKTKTATIRLKPLLMGTLLLLPLSVPAVTYVDRDSTAGLAADGSSWVNAFDNLQDALDCVRSGGCDTEIWVAAGEYFPDEGTGHTPDDPTESFYLIEGTAIFGGFDGVGAGGAGGAQEAQRGDRDITSYKTILSGDIMQDDIDLNGNGIISNAVNIIGTNSEHVVYVDATGLGAFSSATKLNGFYITAGGGGSPGGGGLICHGSATESCDPTFTNLIFRGNKALIGGGMYNTYSNAVLTNVRFSGNEAESIPAFGGAMYNFSSNLTVNGTKCRNNEADYGGCIYNNSSDVTITGTTFESNSAGWHGGAMFNDDSSPSLTDVTFLANSAVVWGGGVFNINSDPVLLNTGFNGNSASAGGAIFDEISGGFSGSAQLTNVVFSGNAAIGGSGGAIHSWWNIGQNLDIQLTNATFNENSATVAGGAIYVEANTYTCAGINVDIVNSILWASTDSIGPNEIHIESGDVTLSYSDLDGLGVTGVTVGGCGTFNDAGNNISVSPEFVDPHGADATVGTLDDNLHLRGRLFGSPSPAIDAGDNGSVTAVTDFDGLPRILDGDGSGTDEVDMGAYEVLVLQIPDIIFPCDLTDPGAPPEPWDPTCF